MRLAENWQECVSSESSGTMEVIDFLCRERESAPFATCQGRARERLDEKRSNMGSIWKTV